MVDDNAWGELTNLSETIYRLKDEIGRCIGHSHYRDGLEASLVEAEKRKLHLITVLTGSISRAFR